MNGQWLSAGVRGTSGSATRAPRCSLARPARNYSCSSASVLLSQNAPSLDSSRSSRHHPPRIARSKLVSRSASSNAATAPAPAPSSSPFPSPYDQQAAPTPMSALSMDDYVGRSLRVNPGSSVRQRGALRYSERPPVSKADPFHLRRQHPAAPCSDAEVAEYFRKLFAPLDFPEELAVRMITHTSWMGGVQGHNSRLMFLGRRFLRASMYMFLQSAEVHQPSSKFDIPPWNSQIEEASGKALDTHVLGREVGGAWELEKVMRWIPVMPDALDTERVLVSSGLLKVRGATVEAVLGGILHQHGGLVAHRAFQTRIVPYLSHHLPAAYKDAARRLTEQMGGVNAMLAVPQRASEASVQVSKMAEQSTEELDLASVRRELRDTQRNAASVEDAEAEAEAEGEAEPSHHSKMLLMG